MVERENPKGAPVDLDALKAAEERFRDKTREYTEPQKPKPFEKDYERGGLSYQDALDIYNLAVQKGTIKRCLFWVPKPRKDGTGQFWFQGKNWAAHRIAYMLAYGLIPEGKKVIRTCGHLRCVKPEHLKLVDEGGLAEAKRKGKKARRGKAPRPKRKRAEPEKWEDFYVVSKEEFHRLVDLVLAGHVSTLSDETLGDFRADALGVVGWEYDGRSLTKDERTRSEQIMEAWDLAHAESRKRKEATELALKKERDRAGREEPDRLSAEVIATLTRDDFERLTERNSCGG